ncbi:hypothetical protein E4582_08030 [Luteimonas yindakuii]|uniref:Uncharacterized protein n=1 Tax=Luteimonas yindakuii TaxID=2565782 RepID=A0A4Z1R5I4_9GAMM|nr:hypothetical protein [Luteimonas yindakuii]TKS54710.1 hypothetical protein E4582_08030 [Luteimonas yindakuii]
MRVVIAAMGLASALVLGGCRAADDPLHKDPMITKDSRQAAQAFVPEVEALLDALGLEREKFSVRANRCAGSEGEQRDDIYTIWIGLRGLARGGDIVAAIEDAHARWQDAGWEITRYRHLDNGGINLAATDPVGNQYALDAGFESPPRYVVGTFNTPCQVDPSGRVEFGEITAVAR